MAVDIGASSGRHIAGFFKDGELRTEEIYRFPNGVKEYEGHLVWDIEGIIFHVTEGLKAAIRKYGAPVSVAVDTWGVDYVLMKGDNPLPPYYAYRDGRTQKAVCEVHKKIPFEELYRKTGIQFQPFNTVYQLYDDKLCGRLDGVSEFLMIPEYITYMLTGEKKREYTNATTTGLVNALSGEFDKEIIRKLGLPEIMFPKLVQPGETVGDLLPETAEKVGGQTKVILCASHDTASAVEAISSRGPYISSGTWSLFGIKTDKPHTDVGSCKTNWSNEGGVGYIRYQKNITGMWFVQSLRKELCPDKDFGQIVKEAEQSAFEGIVDADDKKFVAPKSMSQAIASSFGAGEKPEKESDFFRCAYASVAYGYKKALKELEENTGEKFKEVTIAGGGAKNGFLNRLTEEICNVKVRALPIEATAIGNLKIQIRRHENERIF